MKKLKKILVSIMATAVSVASFCSILNASATTVKYKTYRYFFDAPANTYVKDFRAYTVYNTTENVYVSKSNGNLGGNVSTSTGYPSNEVYVKYVYYTNNTPSSASGCLGSVTFNTTSGSLDFTTTLIKNDRDNTLVTNTVTISEVLIGDVNLDGVVNEADSTLLNKYLAGTVIFSDTQARAADTDNDGAIDNNDAIRILRYVNGYTNSVID